MIRTLHEETTTPAWIDPLANLIGAVTGGAQCVVGRCRSRPCYALAADRDGLHHKRGGTDDSLEEVNTREPRRGSHCVSGLEHHGVVN